jgi:hypothetical protein
MPLVPEHTHILKRYLWRNQKQWTCEVPFCKFQTRNAMDLFGTVFSCYECQRLYKFDPEDVKQDGRPKCPICLNGSPERIVETEVLNNLVSTSAIENLANEGANKAPSVIASEVDTSQVADIVAANLLKEILENK